MAATIALVFANLTQATGDLKWDMGWSSVVVKRSIGWYIEVPVPMWGNNVHDDCRLMQTVGFAGICLEAAGTGQFKARDPAQLA